MSKPVVRFWNNAENVIEQAKMRGVSHTTLQEAQEIFIHRNAYEVRISRLRCFRSRAAELCQ